MHWHNYQVTILVQICWMRNLNLDLQNEDSKTIMIYHFYVSDDKTHDSVFVQHYLLLHWQDTMKDGWRQKQYQIQFNGYNLQFKSKVLLFFMSCYPQLTNGSVYLWSFFGSSHGKGPHDKAGVIVKRFIKQVQFNV